MWEESVRERNGGKKEGRIWRSKETFLVSGQQSQWLYFFSKMKIDWQVSNKYRYSRHLYRGTLGITVWVNSERQYLEMWSENRCMGEVDFQSVPVWFSFCIQGPGSHHPLFFAHWVSSSGEDYGFVLEVFSGQAQWMTSVFYTPFQVVR